MASIRETVIQFLQNIRGLGEPGAQPRGGEGPPARLVLSPGTEVLATVMGKYEDGMSLVRISSHLFAMDLPSRVQIGDSLRMTFLHQDGRPTFALAGNTFSGTPVTLSPAGQLVKKILSDSGPGSGTALPSLPVPEPVLDGPPVDTARLAGRLRRALGESGLFYESHLKEWAQGERPLAEVLREPQGTLSRPDTRGNMPESTVTARAEGGTPAEPAVSGMPPEREPPDAAIPSQREGKGAGASGREQASAEAPARDGRVMPEGRPERGELSARAAAGKGPAEGDSGRAAGAPQPESQAAGPAADRAALSGAEQRARLLKETYGQLDPALLEKKAPDAPVQAPRAEVERNAGPPRHGSTAMAPDAGNDAVRSPAAGTPGISPGEEREGKDAFPASSPLQGEIADSRTLPLVRQQLNLLNSGIVLWQGEAWQGQPMEWEVEEREAHPEEGEDHGWRTTLRLDLPNLGRVAAVINLEGKDLNLSLSAASTESASLLGARTGDLRERLAAVGIEVQGVVVRHEEPEGA